MTNTNELIDAVRNLEQHAPDLRHVPSPTIRIIQADALRKINNGTITNGSSLAEFVVGALKQLRREPLWPSVDGVNPFRLFAQPLPSVIHSRPWGDWNEDATSGSAQIQVIADDPVNKDEDDKINDLLEDWECDYEDQYNNDDFEVDEREFKLMSFMAALNIKSGGDKIFDPDGTVYGYMEKYCISNFKPELMKTDSDSGRFAAGFLANLEYILNDNNCRKKAQYVKHAYDHFMREDIYGDLCSAGISKTKFKNQLHKHMNEDIARIISNQWDEEKPVTENKPGKLPAINKADLDKLDAIVAIMGGNLGIKIADIYKYAEDFRQEAEDLKKKIEGHKEPVGIQALTAEVGLIHMDWHDRLATDVKLGRTVAVRGPAGNGKSTGIKGVLESAGYTIYHLDCTDSTTVDQLVGGLEPVPDGKGGIKMEFKEGVFAKAFKDEKGAIQLDEFDALDPRVTMALQSALHRAAVEKKRIVSCPDHPAGIINAAGDCPIVVSMNTWGTGATREYVGRNAIDAASLDRFDTIINTDYQCEAEMLEKMGVQATDRANLLKEVFSLRKKIAEKGLRVLLSTRRVLNMGECVLALNCTVPRAISREFVERLDEYDRGALNLSVVR